MITTTAAGGHPRPPAAHAQQNPRQQQRQTDEGEDIVDDRGGQVAVENVVGHPQAAAARAVQTRQRLEGAGREDEVRAVRIAESEVGQAAH